MSVSANELGQITLRDLHELSPDELTKVASLHSRVMKGLLTDLGARTVRTFYQLARGEPEVVGYAALDSRGEVMGLVVGSRSPHELTGKVRALIPGFMWRLAASMCVSPALAWRIVSLFLCAPKVVELAQDEIELTYIGVSPVARGAGIGSALIRAFVQNSASRGYRRVSLSVETDNLAAIALYKRHNFRITDTFREGVYHRHRMACEVERN